MKITPILALVAFLLTLVIACQLGTTITPTETPAQPSTTPQTTATETECDLDALSGFFVIYELTDLGGRYNTLVDTKKEIIGAYTGGFLFAGNYVSTGYRMPCEHLQILYDAILQYDLASCDRSLLDKSVLVTDNRYSVLTFCVNGEEKRITWDATSFASPLFSDEFRRVSAVIRLLQGLYQDTDEYLSLFLVACM